MMQSMHSNYSESEPEGSKKDDGYEKEEKEKKPMFFQKRTGRFATLAEGTDVEVQGQDEAWAFYIQAIFSRRRARLGLHTITMHQFNCS